jgi:beta-glucosidase
VSKPTDSISALRRRAEAIRFPEGFVIGAATAAYQIEGAVAVDGRAESIWDRFSHTPGAIKNGDTGDVACDHYHRWRDDVALMAGLNLNAYRFSVAWPRIIPAGRGVVNAAGLDFYDRLVDALLARSIAPFVTLYHWDLPQALQDEGGGWLRRGIADEFVAYADAVSRRLGDRVRHWTTFNELWTFTWWGYAFGEDAPGLRLGAKGALAAAHHALLAHGKAVPVIRANAPGARVGIVLDLNPVSSASDKAEDLAAARRFDGCQNRWYLDALFRGAYPEDMRAVYGAATPDMQSGDMVAISVPLDYLGINVYRRSVIAAGADMPPVNFARVLPPGRYTGIGWEVHPPSLRDILACVHGNYAPGALYITENGAAFPDAVASDGAVADLERADYMISHLEQAARAVREGIPLKGYFAWTLMDNFEWAYGFSQRFGLVHVDYGTQARRVKQSGELYRAIAGAVTRRKAGRSDRMARCRQQS